MDLEERHSVVADLFRRALDLQDEQRERFLREECGDDPALVQEVRSLLAADERGGPFATSVFAGLGAATSPAPDVWRARAGERIGEYGLLEPLGRGGMGEVWVAEQTSLGRRVALKLVLPERVNEHALALFAREARAGGRLNHPGLVAVHAHGQADGVAWIALELVEGAWTLRHALDRLARAEDLPDDYYRQAARFVAKLAEALHAAHAAGVIHRDLKPANVLVAADGRPKVTDFGLARIAGEPGLSVSGDVAGTYAYMSPEQVLGRRSTLDHRTDVFSLGVVLYELLTLRRPFEGDTTHQLTRRILLDDPPDPRTLRSRVPADLAIVCRKCLEKDPAHRYATMAALADDLARHLDDRPIAARPPGRLRRLALWTRRHPTRSIAGALALVAFAVTAALLALNVRVARNLKVALADLETQTLADRLTEVESLWPAQPGTIDDLVRWLGEVRSLASQLDAQRARRDELRARAVPDGDDWRFPDSPEGRQDRWQHARIARLVAGLEGLLVPRTGLLAEEEDAVSIAYGWSVPRRLRFAQGLRDAMTAGGVQDALWRDARAAIRADERTAGLELAPVEGLLPLGRDPRTGLSEFAHLASGDPPGRGADGTLELQESSGVVLVLIPAGTLGGADGVALEPFFLSKYELTQGQWQRITGAPARGFFPGREEGGTLTTLLHPMAGATWDECRVILGRLGLEFPTEAQWEYAARAGVAGPYPGGDDAASLEGRANVLDRTAERLMPGFMAGTPCAGWDDGFALAAPVGRFEPNAFGLHDVLGNVWERCLDEVPGSNGQFRVHRGGSFTNAAADYAMQGKLGAYDPKFGPILGVRPALRIAR